MDEQEFRNSASKFFAKAEESVTSSNSNDKSENMNITRDEFKIYRDKLFKKIDSLIHILEQQNAAKAAAKRAAIEQNIESGNQKKDVEDNVSRMPSVSDVARDGSLAFAALAGIVIGKFDEVVDWGRNLLDRISDGFNSVRRWVEDTVSNITGAASGAIQGAARAAPALLAGPAGIPTVVQGAISGGVQGYNEAQASRNTATTTSFPTTSVPTIGAAAPPRGAPERVAGVRNNPSANAPQNQMREFAEQQGWTVTSAYRPGGGASAHNTGEAIDIRSRDMEVTDDVLRNIYTQFKTRFPGQNFDVFYEPHAPGGAHIHVETGSRAHNVVGILDRNYRVARRINVSDIESRGTVRNAPGLTAASGGAIAEAHVHDHSHELSSGDPDDHEVTPLVVPGSVNTTNNGRMVDETRPTTAPRQVPLAVRNPFATTAWQGMVFGT